MLPSTLADWLVHLESLHPKSIALGLDRVNQVKDRLDLATPFTIITVGGTNGKGSTCAMLERILNVAGYRTGLYTSPHLLRYNERVRINCEQASDDLLCEAFSAVEAVRGDVPLTYFEFGTLAAIWLFAREIIDIAILEVGLGGRLDAVNALDADCAIVVSIGLDHTDYLGKTLDSIANEKAHIYRANKPAIFADREAPTALVEHARAINANLQLFARDFGFETQDTQWQFWGRRGKHHGLPYPALRGRQQLHNASAALAALDEIKALFPVALQHIKRGLLEVELPGRFQVLPGQPTIILDVAHNPPAVTVLAEQLRSMGRFARTHAVFGMLKDKDIASVVAIMKDLVHTWHLGSIEAPRGASATDLLAHLTAQQRDTDATCYASIGLAYDAACRQAKQNDRIIVFGSFFTIAEAMKRKPI